MIHLDDCRVMSAWDDEDDEDLDDDESELPPGWSD
jgi:hypothetical protein